MLEACGDLDGHEEQQAVIELEEYALKGEGAWALSDETYMFIGEANTQPKLTIISPSVLLVIAAGLK